MRILWNRSIGDNLSFNGMSQWNPSPGRVYMEKTIIENGCDCYPWHEVFVWWPVKTISGKRICWRKIYKRKVWVVWGTGFHMEPEIEYAELFEILKK